MKRLILLLIIMVLVGCGEEELINRDKPADGYVEAIDGKKKTVSEEDENDIEDVKDETKDEVKDEKDKDEDLEVFHVFYEDGLFSDRYIEEYEGYAWIELTARDNDSDEGLIIDFEAMSKLPGLKYLTIKGIDGVSFQD